MQPIFSVLTIEPLTAPASVIAGTPFQGSFSIRVSISTFEKHLPLQGFPITVSYPLSGYGDKIKIKTETLTTDLNGVLHFMPPIPQSAVQGALCFSLLSDDYEQSDKNLPENIHAIVPYTVSTAEKKVPTIIAILDYDENAEPIFSDNVTATRLLAGLSF